MEKRDVKKGLLALFACHVLWGFQPLYWAILPDIEPGFLMAARALAAGPMCILILLCTKKLSGIGAVFKDRGLFLREAVAAALLAVDWVVYLVAVKNGLVLACALGYYIMPVVVFFLGAAVFREPVRPFHVVALALILCGIVLSARGFGSVPMPTVILSVAFAVYSAVKKGIPLDSNVSTTVEILFMAPFALAWILLTASGRAGIAALDLKTVLFLLGGGVVTGLPMVFFAIGVKNVSLMTTGITEYLSPTLGILCGLLLGERFNTDKLLTFLFIWAGVAVFSVFTMKRREA